MTYEQTDLAIKPLTPTNFEELAELFAEGGDARWCWCSFWRVRGSAGSRAEADQNRELLRGLAGRDEPAPGLVATRAGRAVGWVSMAPREDLPRLVRSRVLAPVDDRPVWAIVCFVVSESERGRGVGSALLAAAVEYAREHGATTVEAYPLGTHGSSPTGTVSMFERAGFEAVATRQASPSSRPRQIMRRELTPAG